MHARKGSNHSTSSSKENTVPSSRPKTPRGSTEGMKVWGQESWLLALIICQFSCLTNFFLGSQAKCAISLFKILFRPMGQTIV